MTAMDRCPLCGESPPRGLACKGTFVLVEDESAAPTPDDSEGDA